MKILDAQAAAAVVPRPAATTLVVRDGAAGLEVLMVRRSPHASFMPGAYVFPGGAVDAADAQARCDETAEALAERIGRVTQVGAQALAYAVAALRECEEECGLRLGADVVRAGAYATSVLQPWSHWVTPFGIPRRFDTLFFVAPYPAGEHRLTVDNGETTALAWVQPPQALAEHAAGRFAMEFATVRTVESLLPWAKRSVADTLAHAAALRHLPPLHPRVVVDEKRQLAGIRMPGEAGYEAGFGAPDH